MSKREGTFLVQLAKLEAKFKEVFNDQDLALDKRVVYIHGVPADLELSESVGGKRPLRSTRHSSNRGW